MSFRYINFVWINLNLHYRTADESSGSSSGSDSNDKDNEEEEKEETIPEKKAPVEETAAQKKQREMIEKQK